MAIDFVKINTESVKTLGRDMQTETGNLVEMIGIANDKVQETDKYFKNDAATKFRAMMETFAKNASEGSKKNLGNLANYFDTVAKMYEETDETIAKAEEKFVPEDLFA